MKRRRFLQAGAAVPVFASAAAVAAPAPEERNLLTNKLDPERLADILIPRDRWRPWPTAAARSAWMALPADVRANVIAAGNRAAERPWAVLPATLFLEYARNGNRSHYENAQFSRRDKLRDLVMAECAEGEGRFTDEILNGVWLTCEETFWGVPAHLGMQEAGVGLPDETEPVIDLFAAETAALLSWTLYLTGDALDKASKLVRARVIGELERRIFLPGFEREDFWWMGLTGDRSVNNWNPWIVSNWLTATLLWDFDRRRRPLAVHKCLRVLDVFINSYHDDGGCDEGPGYWGVAGASLWECLELLRSATGGAASFFREPLIQEMGRYIYRAHIFEDWYMNFADASAKTRIAGDLVYRYGKSIGDEKMMGLGAWAEARQPAGVFDRLGRALPGVFNEAEIRSAKAFQPLVRDVWLPGLQVMAARMREGSEKGLYVAAQGGHNAESHNHNDVGNFIVFADGSPAIIDVGVETYTAKTFSSKRYDIWTMQSAYHNCPTIGGVMQSPGRQFEARDVQHRSNDERAEFSLDIASAYPEEAGVESWKRSILLDRAAGRLEITDTFRLKKQAPGGITLTLMTHGAPAMVRPGLVRVGGGSLVDIAFDREVFEPAIETIPINDQRLGPVWGQRVYRVLLKAASAGASGTFKTVIARSAKA